MMACLAEVVRARVQRRVGRKAAGACAGRARAVDHTSLTPLTPPFSAGASISAAMVGPRLRQAVRSRVSWCVLVGPAAEGSAVAAQAYPSLPNAKARFRAVCGEGATEQRTTFSRCPPHGTKPPKKESTQKNARSNQEVQRSEASTLQALQQA